MSKKGKKVSRVGGQRTPKGAYAIGIFLAVYCVLLILPYTIALSGAFRSWGDFTDNVFGISKPTLRNFIKVFTEFNYPVVLDDGTPAAYFFDGLTMNSLLVAILAALASATAPLIVGYCTAMYNYRFSRFVIAAVYVLMAMPIVGSLPSEIKMMQNIGLYNTFPGVFFLKFTFCGMYCLIYNSSFKSIPKDYVEAATIDGASDFMIFRKVMFPLVSNTFTIAFILSFVGYWADYSTVLYFMPSHPTLSLALLNFNSLAGTTETMQLAAALLLCIPSLLVFSIFSKNLTKNLQMGGIKG